MDNYFRLVGMVGTALMGLALLVMAITISASYMLPRGAWSCTDFNIKKQVCIRYEYVGQ